MCRTTPPRTNLQKAAHARARNIRRDVIVSLQAAVDDSGVSRRALCRAAGIGPNTFVALERGDREPTIEVLARIAAAMGGELSLRFHPGTGPLVRDHLQAPMIEALLGVLGDPWTGEPEVAVRTPVRGSIDAVLRHVDESVVASEAQSELRRLEQQVRWAKVKADALALQEPATSDARGGPLVVSMLLLLRVSAHNVAVASTFAETLRAAYPAGHQAALAALRGNAPWPGSAIVWMDVRGGVASFREVPPRGVPVW